MANPIDSIPSDGDPFRRPAEPHTDKPIDPNTPKCAGCNSYHGSVNKERNCMVAKIRELEAKVCQLEQKESVT
jgi:hypothetical protein